MQFYFGLSTFITVVQYNGKCYREVYLHTNIYITYANTVKVLSNQLIVGRGK